MKGESIQTPPHENAQDHDSFLSLAGALLVEVGLNSISTYNEGKTVYITESGLYNLIFRSQLPAANCRYSRNSRRTVLQWQQACTILGYVDSNKTLREIVDKDEKKPLVELDPNSTSNYHRGKAVYIFKHLMGWKNSKTPVQNIIVKY